MRIIKVSLSSLLLLSLLMDKMHVLFKDHSPFSVYIPRRHRRDVKHSWAWQFLEQSLAN